MSELDDVKARAQEARAKLVEDSKTAIGMSNARTKLRTAQEIALTMLDNQIELVDQLSALKAEIEKRRSVMSNGNDESVVDEVGKKIGGVGLGAAAGGLIAAPIALGIGAALAPATLGLSLPITIGLVGLGGWLGHKATQRKEQKFVA